MFSRIKTLISFALRDVSKSRTVLILTILSLAAVFTAVILSASILDGFQATLENGSIDSGGHLTIKAGDGGEIIENADVIGSELSNMDVVTGHSTRSYGSLIVNMDGENKGVSYAAIGVDHVAEGSASQIPHRIIEGRFLTSEDTKSVVIGITLADALVGMLYDNEKVKVGDKLRYFSPLNGKARTYTVVGIADTKYFHPNWSSYMPKDEIEWLDRTRMDNEIIVKIKEPEKIEQIRSSLEKNIDGIEVFTWKEKEGYVFNIVTAVKFITGNITNLLILTTFVIMSVIIYINVTQRRRQIGILKSMGASNVFIVSIYVFETMTYFFISFMLAFIVFILIHVFFSTHPLPLLIGDFKTVIVKESFVRAFLILLLAALFGSIVPSYLAARTRIVDVLRGNS